MGKATTTIQEDLAAFAAFLKREGVPPTIREFQDELGLTSTSVADYHLKRLAWEGLIHKNRPGESLTRAWRLTEKGQKQLAVTA